MRIVYQTSSWSRRFFPGSVLIILLALLLSACASSTTAGTGTPPASAVVNPPSSAATATPTQPAGVQLGTRPCPDKVKVLTYWNAYVQLAQGVHVYTVSCANLVGNPSVQALVTTICDCSGGFMSVYVFDGITATTPKAVLHLSSLEKGDARISNYNTVLTAEVDENSSINKKTTTNASLTSDLFREFKWSDGAGALVQIGFSGIFPDMTRFQAELDQQQVNKGQDSWKLSPTQTALNFVQKLFKWHANSQVTLTSGGKNTDTEAVVTIKNSAPAVQDALQVTLNRLEGNANGGIWIVTGAQSQGEQITTPQSAQSVANPIAVQGTAQGTNGTVGTLRVLDHLYDQIGQQVVDAKGSAKQQTLNATVAYTSSYKSGQEEGALVLFDTVNSDGSTVHLHIVKVLLNGK